MSGEISPSSTKRHESRRTNMVKRPELQRILPLHSPSSDSGGIRGARHEVIALEVEASGGALC